MKQFKNLLLSAIVLVHFCMLVSCNDNKQDFAYNEKMTSEFYSIRDLLDSKHKEVVDNTLYVDQQNESVSAMTLNNIKGLAKNCEETKNTVNKIAHSEKANVVHQHFLNYLQTIEKEYVPLLETFAVKEKDTKMRSEIRQDLIKKRTQLSEMEDVLLNKQIQFLKDADIKINMESMH